MKKVLVTGGVGFVGTNLIEELLKQGYKVSSVDNYDTGKKVGGVYQIVVGVSFGVIVR